MNDLQDFNYFSCVLLKKKTGSISDSNKWY